MRCFPLLLLITAALLLPLALLLGMPLPVGAEEEAPPTLEDHPLKDAKPGEFLRYVQTEGNWKKYFIERILDVKDGEVLLEVTKTNEEGTKDHQRVRIGWIKVPEFKPAPHQKILTDEMVEMEVAGKTIWCRHLYIEERVDPDWPEPKRRKDVWYSNDVGCTGKVKDTLQNRMLVDWGTMPESELKERQEAWKKSQQPREKE